MASAAVELSAAAASAAAAAAAADNSTAAEATKEPPFVEYFRTFPGQNTVLFTSYHDERKKGSLTAVVLLFSNGKMCRLSISSLISSFLSNVGNSAAKTWTGDKGLQRKLKSSQKNRRIIICFRTKSNFAKGNVCMKSLCHSCLTGLLFCGAVCIAIWEQFKIYFGKSASVWMEALEI